MEKIQFISLKENKFLITEDISKKELVKSKIIVPTHHIFLVDNSGSMYSTISYIKTDLFNKIQTLLKPEDSVTILWFSGKGEYGVIVEDYRIKSDVSTENLRILINKQMYGRGLTAFKEPLEECADIIKKINSRTNEFLHSLFFITDGHDNSWSEKSILLATESLKPLLASASIVEYGYYCNKNLLNKMASEIGGVHIFADDFQDYEPYTAKQFSQSIESPREYIKLSLKSNDGIAISYSEEGDVITYKISDSNEVFIDRNANNKVIYISDNCPVTAKDNTSIFKTVDFKNSQFTNALKDSFAAMIAYSKKSDFTTISDILRVNGDAYFINKKSNTFGSQKINELELEFSEAIKDIENKSYREGYNPELEPKEDAYCVLDLVKDLSSSEENLFYPSKFRSYKRISRKTERIGAELSQEEKDKLKLLVEEGNFEALAKETSELQEKKKDAELEFVNEDKEKGFTLSNLTWHSSRANLSIQVQYKGYVALPENSFDNLEKNFKTHIFKNYNIISNGIVNNYELPVSLNEETFNKLQLEKIIDSNEVYEKDKIYFANFKNIPVINQKMVKNNKAADLCKNHYALFKNKAENSVYNYLSKTFLKGLSKEMIDKYSVEATEWLKSIGITNNGFSPKSKLAEATEEIMINEFDVKIDKMASAASAKDVYEKIQKLNEKKEDLETKLTPRERILLPFFQDWFKFYDMIKDLPNKNDMIETFISDKSKKIRSEKNQLQHKMAEFIFMNIVGRSWFSDLSSRDEKEILINIENSETKFIFEDKLVTEKI